MDISQFQKISNSKIEAGREIRAVRNDLKEYKEAKQDAYEGLSETYKPIIDVQKSVQKSIDEKQDKVIEQLQKNQRAITSGLEDIILYQQLPETSTSRQDQASQKLPIDYKPEMMPESPPRYKSDLDKGFNHDEIETLMYYNIPAPSDLFKVVKKGDVDFDEFNKTLGKTIQDLGRQKGTLSRSKKKRDSNKEQIDEFTHQIKTLQKYRNRIAIIPEGLETLGSGSGSGIYTQKKRNAYKIDQNGQYGGLIIDLPKLYGYLKVIAHKNGPEGLVKVYEKQGDFDTLDLLTKRFNSKKKYSNLSKIIFDELNQISGIPIHRTSSKFKKMGQGVIYYNNPNDLLDRMELLGGSILAGNDGVKKEFIQIAHTLNKIGAIDNNQLNDLLKEYII